MFSQRLSRLAGPALTLGGLLWITIHVMVVIAGLMTGKLVIALAPAQQPLLAHLLPDLARILPHPVCRVAGRICPARRALRKVRHGWLCTRIDSHAYEQHQPDFSSHQYHFSGRCVWSSCIGGQWVKRIIRAGGHPVAGLRSLTNANASASFCLDSRYYRPFDPPNFIAHPSASGPELGHRHNSLLLEWDRLYCGGSKDAGDSQTHR